MTTALVSPSSLTTLAASPAVADVRPPFLHAAASTDEAVPLTDADRWQTAGFTGNGVNVGIIDLGFAGYTTTLSGATVTLRNQCSNVNATPHGAGVAELVHQMAPAAQLYLICVDSEVGSPSPNRRRSPTASRSSTTRSAWFNTSRGDGPGGAGTPDAIVADARAHGILWVNAAGNDGTRPLGRLLQP